MKTTSALALVAATAALAATHANAQDGAFTTAEKALWIDRHNYFRMTALPFSAGNMLKIKWSDALATAATADAASCAAVTGAGVNAHTHSSSAATLIVDAAFKEWAVTAGLSALSKVKAPKAGEAVGTGVYNSYSQIVWSATNQVGCGFATCPAGKLVVCKYAAPGNSANEPWYIHAPPNSQCPGGTEGKLGLCIVPGDAANNDLAPIPAGQHAYDVFASFIGSMQKVLKGETADGGPATGTGGNTNPGAPAAATPAPAANGSANAAATTSAPAASLTPVATATAAPGAAAGTTAAPGTEASTATTTPATAGSSTTDASVGVPTKAPHSSAGSSASAGTTAGSTASSSDGSTKKSIGFGSITADSGASPGTVRAGSSTGTTFTNGGVNKQGATSQSTDETKSPSGGSGSANNKAGGEGSGGHRFSAAGVAGVVVVGCVMIAGVFVFVSYRKNQRRQRDIMQNGGVYVL